MVFAVKVPASMVLLPTLTVPPSFVWTLELVVASEVSESPPLVVPPLLVDVKSLVLTFVVLVVPSALLVVMGIDCVVLEVVGSSVVVGGVLEVVAGGSEVVVGGCVELVVPPVPTTCRLLGMMPSGISSALIDAKPMRKANIVDSCRVG